MADKFLKRLIEYGVYITAFFTPLIFLKSTKVNFLLPKEAFLSFITPVLLWLWLVREILNGFRFKRDFNPIFIPMLIYLLSIFLSWINSPNLGYSIMASFHMFPYLIIFFVVYFNLKEKRIVNNTILLLMISGGLTAFYGILQYFRIDPFFKQGEVQGNVGKMEVFSTFGNPNFLSPYLAATLPFTFSYIFYKRSKKFIAGISILLSIIIFVCLILSFARSSWIGAFASFFMMFIFIILYDKKLLKLLISKKFIVFYIIFIFISSGLIAGFALTEGRRSGKGLYSIIHYFKDRFTSMTNVWARIMMWKITLKETVKHPIIGKGIFAYKMKYPEMQRRFYKDPENFKKYYRYGVAFRHAHNDYVQTVFEQGIIGLGGFLGIILMFYYQIAQLMKKDKKNFYLYLGFVGGATGVLVDALANFPFRRATPQLTFYLIVAFTAVFYSKLILKKEGSEVSKTINSFIVPKIIFMIILFYPIFLWIREHSFYYLVGNQYLKAGYVTLLNYKKPDIAIKYFNISKILQPHDQELWYWWGIAYMIKRDYNKAEQIFKEALKYSTNNLIFSQLGNIALSKGKINDAIKYFKYAIEIIPLFGEGYYKLGNIYMIKKDYKKAIKYYSKIFEYKCRINPGSNLKTRARLALAECYYNIKDYKNALKKLEIVIYEAKLINKNRVLNMYINLLKKNRLSPLKIAQKLEKIEKYFKDNEMLISNIASKYFEAKEFKKSLIYWKKMLNYTKKKYIIFYNIAVCYYELKDLKNTKKFIDKTLTYEPNFKKAIELSKKLKGELK